MQRTTGVGSFVVAGICSGAYQGLRVAQEDARIVGLWMMDGYTYPTLKTRWLRLRRELKGRLLTGVASGIVRRLRRLPATVASLLGRNEDAALKAASARRSGLQREAFAAAVQSLVDRGVSIFLVQSGSRLEQYNYPEQFRDAFRGHRLVDAVRCDFAPHIDHTITTIAVQDQLISAICDWATELRVAAR